MIRYTIAPTLTLFCILHCCFSHAQKIAIAEPGKPVPQYTLGNIQYGASERIDIRNHHKPLILDFFATGCTACFKSMPKVSQLTAEFGDRVDIVMVGRTDRYIQAIYEKFRERGNIKIPVAYDSAMFTSFAVDLVPHILWIDASGMVRAVTGGMSRDDIQNFLAGEPVVRATAKNAVTREADKMFYDFRAPVLMNNNGGYDSAFLYRSVFARWTPQSDAFFAPEFISTRLKNELQAVGIPLIELYQLAYGDTIPSHRPAYGHEKESSYGDWWFVPLLEMEDKSDFIYSEIRRENLFTYSTILPSGKGGAKMLQAAIRKDLGTYFPYHAAVETRQMPYWSVTIKPDAVSKLITKGGKPSMEIIDKILGIRSINQRVSTIMAILDSPGQRPPAFVDETGIHQNIDLLLDARLTDFNEIKTELERHGFIFEMKEKLMKVVVIHD